MEPAEKKAVVEAFDSHGVCNVPCIWGVQRRFHIETEELSFFLYFGPVSVFPHLAHSWALEFQS